MDKDKALREMLVGLLGLLVYLEHNRSNIGAMFFKIDFNLIIFQKMIKLRLTNCRDCDILYHR